MLIKEYRIPLPLTVDEYRIAQLFMIQKKSRLESSGAGSGVEIIKNEPYQDGPGGQGQYTYKIYHIGNRIPIWIRNVLPSSALEAHEEAWNAYPYTRTRYSCPLISHFCVEVDTKYLDDAGQTENIFELGPEERKGLTIDVIDFVRDPISSHDYSPEEDPKLYRSERRGRGPLTDNWVEEASRAGRPVMCAYKLCKVEFKYWGLQSRAERWIHELALRGTMLRAHRQAWAWQDEWTGLDMGDIRRLEQDTQKYLCSLMAADQQGEDGIGTSGKGGGDKQQKGLLSTEDGEEENGTNGKGDGLLELKAQNSIDNDGTGEEEEEEEEEERMMAHGLSPSTSSDIYFDCSDQPMAKLEGGQGRKPALVRWSSELLVNEEELEKSPPRTPRASSRSLLVLLFHGDLFPKTSADSKITDADTLRSTLDTLILSHYPQLRNRVFVQCVKCGSGLVQVAQLLNGLCSSFGTFHPSLGPLLASNPGLFTEAVQSTIFAANRVVHDFMASSSAGGSSYPAGEIGDDMEIFAVGDFIGGLLMWEALARTGAQGQPAPDETQEQSPVAMAMAPTAHGSSQSMGPGSAQSCSPLASTRGPEWCLSRSLPPAALGPQPQRHLPLQQPRAGSSASNNSGHHSFFTFDSQPGNGNGRLAAGNANNVSNSSSISRSASPEQTGARGRGSAPPSACRQASNSSEPSFPCPANFTSASKCPPPPPPPPCASNSVLSFRPSAAFLLGCPLALVLMQRKLTGADLHLGLACDQLFNLYYALDLCAARLEPVLNPSLALLPALKVPRYQRYPLGDGLDMHYDSALDTPMIWGPLRVDHELFCPNEMSALPGIALPSILHASYWESKDVGSFLLRQFLRSDELQLPPSALALRHPSADQPPLLIHTPLNGWNRRRTRFKVANLAANHRANDLLVVEDQPQLVQARFCYGPMDLVALSHENVLVYVLPDGGDWHFRGVETTDKHGRLAIQLGPSGLPVGMHHMRLVVQGDHTFLCVCIAVVPRRTAVVVFSIDGSLTASVSVTGRDPRLRPGAIDVVRFWQQQGYLLLYLTARPDMQQRLVSAWLATHNFPHALLAFMPSLSTDPLRQKTQYMRQLVDQGIRIQAAYGSAKDIAVYSNAGLEPERIFKVGGHQRRGCVSLANGYCSHLHDLHAGRVPVAQPAYGSEMGGGGGQFGTNCSGTMMDNSGGGGGGQKQKQNEQQRRTALGSRQSDGGPTTTNAMMPPENGTNEGSRRQQQQRQQQQQHPIQRTLSFGPRTGKYSFGTAGSKKISQVSAVSSHN